jgi:hypothetical protein
MNTPIVRRIDHIMIRVPDPAYDRLHALLTGILELPTPWPVTHHPAFKSGGVFAGNVDLELLRVATDPPGEQASLYGVVFEAWSEHTGELAARGIPYLLSPYVSAEAGKAPTTLWTNVFFSGLLGSNTRMKALFAARRLAPDWLWSRLSPKNSADDVNGVEFMFNRVYGNGIVFMVSYNPAWRNVDAERRANRAELRQRAGGALGLVRVQEVGIGTTNLTSSAIAWRSLLRPALEVDAMCWQPGDGPAVRIVAADQDAIRYLIWEVESLDRAQAALEELELLGAVFDNQITINPELIFGLDIRLVDSENLPLTGNAPTRSRF